MREGVKLLFDAICTQQFISQDGDDPFAAGVRITFDVLQ